jgi:hypothetical protein
MLSLDDPPDLSCPIRLGFKNGIGSELMLIGITDALSVAQPIRNMAELEGLPHSNHYATSTVLAGFKAPSRELARSSSRRG